MLPRLVHAVKNILPSVNVFLATHLDRKAVLVHSIASVTERKQLEVGDGLERIPRVVVIDDKLSSAPRLHKCLHCTAPRSRPGWTFVADMSWYAGR